MIDYALDYVKYCAKINEICEEYPFVKADVIGKSVLGKNIYALTAGEGFETVLFAAAFHGSEHITTNIALMFFENLCKNLLTDSPMCEINLRRGLKGRSVTVIPRVNPDGCDISILGLAGANGAAAAIRKMCMGDYRRFNANARGVDINHNFNAGWEVLKAVERSNGINAPASRRFGGFTPESEPETKAAADFCRKNNICHALALHSQGEVIYWNYGSYTPPRSLKMAQIFAGVSGYALDVPAPIATGGGFKDFFIKEFRRPAFTVELGLGENPLPPEQAGDIYEKTEEMFTLAAIM